MFRVWSNWESWLLISWASVCSIPLLMRVRVALVRSRWESMVRWGSMVLVSWYDLSVLVVLLSDLRMVFALLMR